MAVLGAHKIESLFKEVSGLKLHKNKVKEVSDIVDKKFHDLLLIGESNAKYNGRDVIWYSDLPLTKAFRESMNKFENIDSKLQLDEILQHIKTLPPLYTLEIELEKKLTIIVGTILYIMAKIAKDFSTDDKVISEDDLDKTVDILNLTI